VISIIVRTRNEGRWITLCLEAIWRQNRQDFEVIVVDNESTDKTIQKALEFDVKVVTISKYFPGKAINLGIESSSGDIIVCISAHCVPVTDNWLDELVSELEDSDVAGVYGRQQPMSFSSDNDKRDLLTIFGLDKKVQIKDSFFHNANSAFRRATWEEYRFDEDADNVEDRIWAARVIRDGYKIVYKPEASVYHYHGIFHDYDKTRRENAVRVLESLEPDDKSYTEVDLSTLKIVALVPVRGEMTRTKKTNLLDLTLDRALESKHLKTTFLLSDNAEIIEYAKSKGVEAPFIRPPELSLDHVGIQEVLAYSIDQLMEINVDPDICVVLEQTYPFRSAGLIDQLIERFMVSRSHGLLPCHREQRLTWTDQSGVLEFMNPMMPRSLKTSELFIGLFGLGFVTYPKYLLDESLGFDKLDLFEVEDQYSLIEVRNKGILTSVEHLLDAFWKESSSPGIDRASSNK